MDIPSDARIARNVLRATTEEQGLLTYLLAYYSTTSLETLYAIEEY